MLGRLDYCNSILVGHVESTTALSQRVQHAVARPVLDQILARSREPGALSAAHRFHVAYRIKLKGSLLYFCLTLVGVLPRIFVTTSLRVWNSFHSVHACVHTNETTEIVPS